MSSRGWILFLAMSIIWGIPYLLIKIAVEGVSVPVLVFTRVAVGAAVLLPLALSRQTVTIVRNHWKALLGSRSSRSSPPGGCSRMPSAISPAR